MTNAIKKNIVHPKFQHKMQPVFSDPSHHRWIGFVAIISVVSLYIAILAVTLTLRVYTDPDFKTFTLDFPGQRFIARTVSEPNTDDGANASSLDQLAPRRDALTSLPRSFSIPPHRQLTSDRFLSKFEDGIKALSNFLVPGARAAEVRLDLPPEIFAFYVNWDPASENALREHIHAIDVLVPEWLHLANGVGDIEPNDPLRTQETLELIKNTNPAIKIAPLLNNYISGVRDTAWINDILESPKARAVLVANTLEYIRAQGFSGVTIDLSGMREENCDAFILLAEEFYNAFKPHGLVVYHTLPLNALSKQVTQIANFAEAIIVLALGEHNPDSPSGPLASQSWYEENLLTRFLEVPASKLVIGLVNYAFDWPDGLPVAETYSVQEAFTRARQANARYSMDSSTLNPTFSYLSDDESAHTVWLLDAMTGYNQLKHAVTYRPRGVALWRLGSEDPSIWSLLTDPDNIDPDELRSIPYTYQIDRYGDGEVRQLTNLPSDGHREFQISEESALIESGDIDRFPRGFEIMQWGGKEEKLLALTFDDGPDPEWSPKILDVLAEHKVPATFFSTGINMLKHPEIVRRMLDEGHEVGNHTYSHVNVAAVSNEVLRLELNATQRIFESITGRNFVLFRPPYAQDSNPQSPSEIRPLATISEMGYFAVHMNIYARDWWLPDADRIVEWIDNAAHNQLGNIILLHDGGGDRSQTVAALGIVVEHLRSEGFRFVTVSELIGKTNDTIMPQLNDDNTIVQVLQSAGFSLIRLVDRWAFLIFLLTIVLGVGRSLAVLILAFIRGKPTIPTNGPNLTVGVVVPAFNEEKVILQTVRSLLASNYPNLKILIVDDGSTDRTSAICKEAFAANNKVQIVTQNNSGKSEALNLGFNQLDTDIVVALDADTLFLPDTISKLVRNFSRKQVVAVSGNAKVGNRVNLLTKWQALEYITAQNIDRRASELINCIPVVPGAVGAWKRTAVLEAGGFASDTLAEDADLTFRLIRDGHRVVYDEAAIALTEAPETIRQFMKQRFRWMFGMMQVAFKHLGALRLKDSKSVGLVSVPNILIFQILFPIMAPIIDLMALIAISLVAWNYFSDAPFSNNTEPLFALSVFFVFILVDFLSAVAAFSFEKSEDKRLLFWLIPQRFFYRQLIYIVAIKAVIAAIKGSRVGWGTLKRSANVRSRNV